MTARRQARGAGLTITPDSGAAPRSLLLGACIEVWADDTTAPDASWTARNNHHTARRSYLDTLNLTIAEECALIPTTGAPWSLERPTWRAPEAHTSMVDHQLSRAGTTRADIAALRREAQEWANHTRPMQYGRSTSAAR